jgi:cell volume regulation protein A
MEPLATGLALAVLGALLIVAVLAGPLSQRTGVPALAIFLALGMLAGSEGLGRIPFDDYGLAFRLGVVALVLILFDGGLNTPHAAFRRALGPAVALATVAVVLTAVIVAGVGVLLGLPLPIAVLVGAVVSSTDAAAVFSVLRGSGVRLDEKTGTVLEVESGLNDPMAVLLTMAATEAIVVGRIDGGATATLLATQTAGGLAGGVILGWGGRWLLQRVRLPAAGLYPVLTVGLAFTAFGLPTMTNGSGFLAVYLAAVILAAGALPYRAGVRRVHDALAWLAQILMFLMLGLLVFPSRLLPSLSVGLGLALALALVARPLAVGLVLWPFSFAPRERLFIAWVGLRGAVPIILATYPALRGLPEGDAVFHLVFFVVVANAVLPGSTVAWIGRRLGVAHSTPPVPPASVELISLADYQGQFVWYSIRRASAVAGAMVRDLPLPSGCVLTLILRGDDVIAARGATTLEPGDHVCVFVTPADRPLLDLLFGRPDDAETGA